MQLCPTELKHVGLELSDDEVVDHDDDTMLNPPLPAKAGAEIVHNTPAPQATVLSPPGVTTAQLPEALQATVIPVTVAVSVTR